jgi:Fe-S-cluster containining protein
MDEVRRRVEVPLETASAAQDDALNQLERQVERASLYTHTAIGQNALRLGDLEGFVFGLIDVLMAKELVTSQEVEAAIERVKAEMANNDDYPSARVAMRVDLQSQDDTAYVPVNCAERMPICNAVCCKLHFALSQGEVESGKVKWDLGQPYYIRHETNGFCSHNDRQTGGCSIYADRPGVCRKYSCANDERIWKDFDNMELNREWLDANLNRASRPQIMATSMSTMDSDGE